MRKVILAAFLIFTTAVFCDGGYEKITEECVDKFVLIGKMKAKPGCEEKLEKTLQALSKGTYTEPGCLFYALHRDSVDPSIFVLVEGWTSKEALQTHFTAPHFLEYFPVLSSLIDKEPELTYLNPLGKEVKGTLFKTMNKFGQGD